MKYVLIVAVVSVISGCAGLMPKEERTVQFIETTNATKSDAFNRASKARIAESGLRLIRS